MKIYKHTGNGHYIGSCIVVVAFNKELAEHKIKKLLVEGGLPNEGLNIEEFDFILGRVIVNDNGDY